MTAPRTDPQSTVPVEPPDDPLRVAQQALASLMAFAGFAIPSANRDEQWDKPDEEAASILGAMLDAGYITIPGDAARASQPITATADSGEPIELAELLREFRLRSSLEHNKSEASRLVWATAYDMLAALPVREEPTGIDVERLAHDLVAFLDIVPIQDFAIMRKAADAVTEYAATREASHVR